MNEWKDIKEAPRDYDKIIIYAHDELPYDIAHYNGTQWEGFTRYYDDKDIIGWMPFPDPPKKTFKFMRFEEEKHE